MGCLIILLDKKSNENDEIIQIVFIENSLFWIETNDFEKSHVNWLRKWNETKSAKCKV